MLSSYDDMKILLKWIKEDLKANYPIDIMTIVKKSKVCDGSIKYLLN